VRSIALSSNFPRYREMNATRRTFRVSRSFTFSRNDGKNARDLPVRLLAPNGLPFAAVTAVVNEKLSAARKSQMLPLCCFIYFGCRLLSGSLIPMYPRDHSLNSRIMRELSVLNTENEPVGLKIVY